MGESTATQLVESDRYAASLRDMYMALLAVSFNEEQAMRILLAVIERHTND